MAAGLTGEGVEVRCVRKSYNPPAIIDPGRTAVEIAVYSFKCAEISERAVLPSRSMACQTVWIATKVWSEGIDEVRLGCADDYTVTRESSSRVFRPAINRGGDDAGRATERTQVDEFVARVLRRQLKRRQCGK